MKKVIEKMKTNTKCKRALYYLEYAFLFLYTFSLPSFSAREPYNLISYFSMILLIINTIICTLLYSRFFFKKHFLVMPIFVIWIFIGTIIFSHQFRGMLSLFLLSITLFSFYFSFMLIKDFGKCIKLIILSLLAFSIYFIVVYWRSIISFSSYSSGSFRLGDYFDNVNHVGTYFFIGSALSIFFLLFGRKTEKLFGLSGVVFIFLGMTTGSREFVVSVLLILIVLLFFRFRKKKWIFLLSLLGILVVLIVLINLPFMATIKTRFDKMIIALLGGGGEGSTTTRLLWQLYGVVLGSKNIIPGYGFYGFGIESGVGTYTHANYSEIICNGGIIGFLLFYGYLIYILWKTAISNNSFKSLAASFVFVLLLLSPISIYYSSKETYLLLGLIISIMDTKFEGEILWTPKKSITYFNESFYEVNI